MYVHGPCWQFGVPLCHQMMEVRHGLGKTLPADSLRDAVYLSLREDNVWTVIEGEAVVPLKEMQNHRNVPMNQR